jgi:hypothetical protein
MKASMTDCTVHTVPSLELPDSDPSTYGDPQLCLGEDNGLGPSSSEEAASIRPGDVGTIAEAAAVRVTWSDVTSSTSIGSSAMSQLSFLASKCRENINGSTLERVPLWPVGDVAMAIV